MTPAQRRRLVLDYAKSPEGRRWQFGQAQDQLTFDGMTACGHTCVQFIVGLVKRRLVTLNDVARAVGYPDARQAAFHIGLYERQVIEALKHFGIGYEIRGDLSARELIDIAHQRGPVIIEYVYGWTPERQGYTYRGVRADGRPNGYARPLGTTGKTQLVGFEDGYHYSLLLSYYKRGSERERVYFRDTNRDSLPRPESSAYDVISQAQFARMYRSLDGPGGKGYLWAAIPKKAVL